MEYQEVMAEAANSMRMAIAIKTADRFTIMQLLAVLWQKICTEDNYGKLAPYIDVFTLQRRCLSIKGVCRSPLGPVDERWC
jgi:hypothetical protein